MATAEPGAGGRRHRWTPARLYLVISGSLLIAIGAAGFAVDASFPTAAAEVERLGSGHLFGILETNGWHNVAGLASGVVAVAFAARAQWARLGALLQGGLYTAVTAAVAIWGGETFWIASNTADQVVHALLAVGGLASGLATPTRSRERRQYSVRATSRPRLSRRISTPPSSRSTSFGRPLK